MPESPAPVAPLLLFARNFLRHPRMLGSVIPSSRFLIDSLLARVDWQRARVIVEYGPGIGTFTAKILRRMRPDAQLIAIETNEEFVRFLRRTYPTRQLTVLHDSAANVGRILAQLGHASADYVVSGIPFSTMPAHVRESILHATHAALASGGEFLVYQFSSRVRADLERIFGRVESGFEPLNVLPAQLFFCAPAPGRSAAPAHDRAAG